MILKLIWATVRFAFSPRVRQAVDECNRCMEAMREISRQSDAIFERAMAMDGTTEEFLALKREHAQLHAKFKHYKDQHEAASAFVFGSK